jgi:hypothetical protein
VFWDALRATKCSSVVTAQTQRQAAAAQLAAPRLLASLGSLAPIVASLAYPASLAFPASLASLTSLDSLAFFVASLTSFALAALDYLRYYFSLHW